jgi:formate dehydrogenase subunit gamma
MAPAGASIADLCSEILARHAMREGALLPILRDVQQALGCVPAEAVPVIAEALNLTRAEVHGVVSFYHDFREAPPGRRVVKLCQAEACQARGGRAVTGAAEAGLGLRLGETSPDGAVTLEAVYCLGLCASGPAALVDGRPHARLVPDEVVALLRCASPCP